MPKNRKAIPAFGLSFLDVMACGLGAVTLIFMLVKYQTNVSQAEADHGNLDSELAEMRSLQSASEKELETLRAEYQGLVAKLAGQESQMASRVADQEGKEKELQRLMKEVQNLEKAAAAQQKTSSEDPAPVAEPSGPKQHHLLGIRVEGKRILILVDNSASMAETRIVDILKVQVSNDAAKRAAPKWQRTLKAVEWLVERVPEDSSFMIVHYNANADFVHGNRWIGATDESQQGKAISALAKLVPDGATNLYNALEFVVAKRISPSNMYIVTDGLPTSGPTPGRRIRRNTGCKSFGKTKSTISGECREALFYDAVNAYNSSISGKVNTILLPLEGDPEAVFAYWAWASSKGGTVTSPGSGWP